MKNSLTVFTGSLLISVAILLSSLVMAGPPDCSMEPDSNRCKKKGDGSSGSDTFAAKFCLDVENSGFAGDGSGRHDGDYCDDKKEKVLVFTGSGPGFRFDTNKGKSAAVRYLQINFPGGDITVNDAQGQAHTYNSGRYEIDFRFDLNSGGLALEDLDVNGPSGEVAIGVKIQSMDGSVLGLLGYGDAADLFSDPSLDTTCMLDNTKKAVVTRGEDTDGVVFWEIESNPDSPPDACLWVGHSRFEGQSGTPVEMPFFFTIRIP